MPRAQHLARGKQHRKAPASSVYWVFVLGSYSSPDLKPTRSPKPGGWLGLGRTARVGRGCGPGVGRPRPPVTCRARPPRLSPCRGEGRDRRGSRAHGGGGAPANAYLHMRRLDIYNFSTASSKLLMS